MNELASMIAEHAAAVNARLAAAGRCIMHNPEINEAAAVIIRVPIGNELPLCALCWEWWQGTLSDDPDPLNIPVWVRSTAVADTTTEDGNA